MNRPKTPHHAKLVADLRKTIRLSGFRQSEIGRKAGISRQHLWHMLQGDSFSKRQYERVMDAVEQLATERARQLAALRQRVKGG